MKPSKPTTQTLTIRTNSRIVERLDRLIPALQAHPLNDMDIISTRSDVLHLVLKAGIKALERECGLGA